MLTSETLEIAEDRSLTVRPTPRRIYRIYDSAGECCMSTVRTLASAKRTVERRQAALEIDTEHGKEET